MTRKVMIQCLEDAVGVQMAQAKEIAQHFLLFRVHADHGFPCLKILLLEFGDVLKLFVPVGISSHGDAFLRLAF